MAEDSDEDADMADCVTFFHTVKRRKFMDGDFQWTPVAKFDPPLDYRVRGRVLHECECWRVHLIPLTDPNFKQPACSVRFHWTLSVVKGQTGMLNGSRMIIWKKSQRDLDNTDGDCDSLDSIEVKHHDIERNRIVADDGSITFMWFVKLFLDHSLTMGISGDREKKAEANKPDISNQGLTGSHKSLAFAPDTKRVEWDQLTLLTQSQRLNIVLEGNEAEIRFHEEKLRRLRLEREQHLIQQVEQARYEEQIKEYYGKRIDELGKTSKEFVKKEKLQELLGNTQFDPNIPCVLHDEDILNRIRTLFVSTIEPMNILHIFHKYNRNVLVQKDIDVVSEVTPHYGKGHGAAELLGYLVRYEGWFSTLVQVLRDPDVKQDHVADAMWDALGMGNTTEKNLPIDQVKQKLQTAVRTLQKMKQFHREDGIKCLTFIYQTIYYYDSDSDRRDVGDCLTDCGFVERCMKFLQDHLNSVTINDDEIWPAIDTLVACWDCSSYSLKFTKKLVELDGVRFSTEILRNRCYLDNLHRERESRVVEASTLLLKNIVGHFGIIDEFKDSRTVKALMPLTKCESETIKVKAMITLAFLVNEEKEEERKDKLTDTSSVISTVLQWIPKALENKKERRHQGLKTWELTQFLTIMAVCDKNKRKIIDGGGLPVFLLMLSNTNPVPDELSWTARCVEQLAHDESIKQNIRDYPGLVPALEELKKRQDQDVRDSVVCALRIIQDQA